MEVSRLVNTVFTSCTWVLDGVWLVDCGDVEPLLPLIGDRVVKGVLLTHGHFDHIYGLNDLCSRFPEARVYCSAWARDQLLNAKLNLSYYHETPFELAWPDRIEVVEDGEEVDMGDGKTVTAVATPGHTPGCITWMTNDLLFTGDAYIPGTKVVTNLPHGDRRMAASSIEKILALADCRTICPGHDVDQIKVPEIQLGKSPMRNTLL